MSNTKPRSKKKNFKTELKRLGLTQAEFSRMFRVPTSTVQNWVSGRTATPTWVAPALKLYEMVPNAKGQPSNGDRPEPSPPLPPAHARESKHPFARIDEL